VNERFQCLQSSEATRVQLFQAFLRLLSRSGLFLVFCDIGGEVVVGREQFFARSFDDDDGMNRLVIFDPRRASFGLDSSFSVKIPAALTSLPSSNCIVFERHR
jgi:hypothetical protein